MLGTSQGVTSGDTLVMLILSLGQDVIQFPHCIVVFFLFLFLFFFTMQLTSNLWGNTLRPCNYPTANQSHC